MNTSPRTQFIEVLSFFAIAVLAVVASPVLAASDYDEFKLQASDGAPGSYLGSAVAVDGDLALVGAHGADVSGEDSGAVYVFSRQSDGGWVESARLVPGDGAAGDVFGRAVALDGNRAIVGAYQDGDNGYLSGSAYVFERQPDGTWLQVAKLLAADGAGYDYFGNAVAVEHDTVLVGASRGDANDVDTGAVYVFDRQPDGSWTQSAKLRASDGLRDDRFGESVSLNGGLAVVGAVADDDNGYFSGSAFVFERGADGTWSQVAKLLASDGDYADFFGCAVAVSGETAVVGAYGNDDLGQVSGSAYIFERQADRTWVQVTRLVGDSIGSTGALFGYAVAAGPDRLAVGAPGQLDLALQAYTGATYTFSRQLDGSWLPDTKLLASDRAADDGFGAAVAVNDDVVLIGAPGDDDKGASSGSAYVFSPHVVVQAVILDIKPGSCTNPLNVTSRGVVPAAVLGTTTFHVTQIDPQTLKLAGVAPLRWDYEDVAAPNTGDSPSDCSAATLDGYYDLSLKFDTQAVVQALGSVTDREVRTLTLTGALLDGTPITGTDVVVTLSKTAGGK